MITIIDPVNMSQKDEDHRLTLALPLSDVDSYYDAKLLRDVTTIDEGLLLRLAKSYGSNQTAFQIYRTQVVSMPQLDATEAIRWGKEGPYLAILEDLIETRVLTEKQNSKCLGTTSYRICHQTMETQLEQSLNLATLFSLSAITALTVRETQKILLPTP